MLSLAEYFPFLSKQTITKSEEEILEDKRRAVADFENARKEFAKILLELTQTNTDLAKFYTENGDTRSYF